MNIGVCFGGYCPLHMGHLDLIMKAKKNNDKVLLIVCGYDNESRANEIRLPLKKRVNKVREFFKNDEQIVVTSINDTELGLDKSMSINNWRIWLNEVQKRLDQLIPTTDSKITFYVAEPFYKESIEKVKSFDVVLMDKVLKISGTEIRKNPLNYWSVIAAPFRETLTKNILITGTASEGKSTLVKDISRYFGCPFAEEYGRTYMEEKCMLDTDLSFGDFAEFLIGQREDIKKKSAKSNNGLFISDTDNMVTLMYAQAYGSDKNIDLFTEKDYERLKTLAYSMGQPVKWDKVFMIEPHNTFVDDGTRYMNQSSLEERKKNFSNLQALIADDKSGISKDSIQVLNGTFEENFEAVKSYILSLG